MQSFLPRSPLPALQFLPPAPQGPPSLALQLFQSIFSVRPSPSLSELALHCPLGLPVSPHSIRYPVMVTSFV